MKQKFKQTEIGMIPEDWEVKKLDEISIKITDGSHYSPSTVEDGKLIATVKDMGDFGFIYETCRKISQKDFDLLVKNDCKPLINDVLIAKDGSFLKQVFVSKGEDIVILSSIAIIRPDIKKIEPKYLKYVFSDPVTKNRVGANYVSGAVIQRIILKDFKKIQIPYPATEEQKQISKILSDLDSKIELNQQMNKTLEEIGQTIFKHWFVDFEFPNEEGKPYKSSGGEGIYNEELDREIPKGWKVKELGDFIEFVKGKKPSKVFENQEEGLLPQILIDVLDGGTPTFSSQKNMVLSSETEVLMVMDGASSGRTERGFAGVLGSTIAKIKVEELNQDYVYYLLKGNELDIKVNTTGTSIPHADKKKIEKYLISVPPKKILEDFQNNVNKLLFRQILIRREIKNLSQIRDSLLPKLMSGKIRVPVEVET